MKSALEQFNEVYTRLHRHPERFVEADFAVLATIDPAVAEGARLAHREATRPPAAPASKSAQSSAATLMMGDMSMEVFVDALSDILREWMATRDRRLTALEARPASGGPLRPAGDLEQRVAHLERRPALTYVGVFKEGSAYGAGSLCTRGGSLWLAEDDTVRVPGTVGSHWRLIVKHGQA
jgi:hypothetical protein